MACRVVVGDASGAIVSAARDLWEWLGTANPRAGDTLRLADIVAALPAAFTMQSLPMADGTTAHVISSAGDTIAGEAADENRLLRETLDAVDASIVVHDSELRFRLCNKGYHERYPYLPPAHELVGRHFSEVLRMSIAAGIYASPRAVTDTEAYVAERVAEMGVRTDKVGEVFQSSTGKWSQVRVRWTPAGNRVTLRVDMTQSKRMEEELIRTQRVKTVGRISGGVAHHFNNLLTVICGSLDMVLQHPELPPASRVLAERALAGAEKGGRLTQQLLTFARRAVTRPRRIDPNLFLDSIAALLQGALGSAATLVMHLDDAAAQVWIDPATFETAMMNLILNARDATAARTASLSGGGARGAGMVAITTGLVRHNAKAFRRIAVADDGEGMSPEVAAEAFEPFFTTRHMSVASGLGLSQVHGFADAAGGLARISSTRGDGTVVEILLPVVDH